MNSERIVAIYEVPGPTAEADKIGRAIAFEETVEVPFDFPLKDSIRDGILGKVGKVSPLKNGRCLVEVDFPAALASNRIGTLLNLVFGNASIWPGVKLVDIRWPPSFLAAFPGPNFGVVGLRQMLRAEGRPLLATALKPGGSTNVELAEIAAAFARGGGDIAKDDQNIVDEDFAAFKSRVSAIAQAVLRENDRSKRLCLYLPHLAGPQQELESRLKFVLKLGLRGALVCPAILGLDEVRRLAAKHPALYMSHPAFSGSFYADRAHGIDTSLYLGTLMRLIGADITVFPNSGGRFGFNREECRAIAQQTRSPLGTLAASWPAPGGGMRLDNAADMRDDFGVDSVWLVGGALLMHPGGAEAGARAFRAAMA